MATSTRVRATWIGIVAVAGVAMMPRLLLEPKPGDGFASGRTATTVPFDSKRALGYLKQLCDLGPRLSGSASMTKQQDIIEQHFTKLGAKVTRQKFTAKQFSQANAVAMTNLVISWHPDRDKRVLLCTHYDTRPIADQEPDRAKWNQTFVSANDGTSGVAWLMEFGHHVKDMKLNVGVDFVIFDGEEYVFDSRPGMDKYFFGSEHFAADYKKARPAYKYIAGVLFDLCFAKDPQFPIEVKSQFHAGAVIEQVWSVAGDLKEPMFVAKMGPEVQDDHLALNHANIPTIDIIDFDYPHWHRLSDTPDKISGETMSRMSKVISTWLSRIK
jgi:glutaminyl-peptide cyclotransferase